MWRQVISKYNTSRCCINSAKPLLEGRIFKEENGRALSKQRMHGAWGYKAGTCTPEHWNMLYPIADGKFQSPIDIVEGNASKEKKAEPLVLDYNKNDITCVSNSGHSVTFHVEGANSFLTGAFLANKHRLLQFHFHWGAEDGRGSEHTLNGKEFSAELHLVHLNTKYESFEEALKHSDGLCVLGAFLEADETGAEGYDRIADLIQHVKYKNQKYSFEGGFDVKTILPKDLETFFSYDGSLTTPPLSECVQWLNLLDPVKISRKNLAAFRCVCSNEEGEKDEQLTDNYRPPQPLHNRMVHHCCCK